MTMSQPGLNWQKYGTLAQLAQATVALLGFAAILFQINEVRTGNNAAQPAYFATYGTETQQWVKNSLKTASVAAPDCKLGRT
jgi:hypothetical protein